MKITPQKYKVIINRYHELLNKVCEFLSVNKKSTSECGIHENGNIYHTVNTSCRCHPKYETKMAATKQEFLTWLETNQ